MSVLKRVWLPLVIVVIMTTAGTTIHRVRSFFGSAGTLVTPVNFADDPESFDPKVVVYEVFGTGTYANINYLDLQARPQRLDVEHHRHARGRCIDCRLFAVEGVEVVGASVPG